MSFSLNLIFNLSLLVAISVISAIITDKRHRKILPEPILQGIIFGSAAVIGLLFPVVLSPGVIFDGRSVVLSLCGLFFGPVSGIIAGLMAIVTRVALGGNGMLMGILVIISSLGIGLIYNYVWNGNMVKATYWKLYLMGIIVHIVLIALMFTLPWESAVNAFRHISIPILIFYPIATVIMGKILKVNFDRMQALEELKLQKERADQSNRLKDIFIANISHEIRTPLNAILGFASIIEDEASDRFTQEEQMYFQRINQSGRRLTRTIDEILNYSRLLIKDLQLNKIEINLPSLIESLILESKTAHPKQITEVLFDNSIGAITICADEFCIRNSVSNLVDNALKYTDAGAITVKLYRDDQNRICISVTDTGIGMSEKFLENLFQPYSQEANGFTRRYEGVGLGLSIVKRLCDIMQAEISVTSKKGEGSAFTIILPDEHTDVQ